MEPVIVVLIVFGSVGFIVYTWISTRHKERIAMIEKGVNPGDFKGMSVREMFRTSPLSTLKWGILAFSVGLGLIAATYIDEIWIHEDSVYPASMLIFGGLGLILFYLIAARKLKDQE
ncbi:MAG TPA: DUF6249 domain-containing protein [Bacteroidota bacterium]|nr:DUF6249 domain-containing protein [Bacteroidota bacterium]